MTRSVLVKKQKTKGKNEFQGRWRITWMAQWDQEYVDEEVEGYFKFGAGGHGEFEFGYIQGSMDHRTIVRGGEPTIEFSWEGDDAADGTALTGRGWGVLEGEELTGMIHIYFGDESEFTARKG